MSVPIDEPVGEADGAPIDDLVLELLRGTRGNHVYDAYEQLRGHDPIHRAACGPFWAITSHHACEAVLRDRRFGKGDARLDEIFPALGATAGRELRTELVPSLLFLNPPEHTRVRALVNKAFTPRRVDELRPRVERITDGLLDELEDRAGGSGAVDVMDEFAFTLPFRVIAELVGVPESDQELLRRLFPQNAKSLELSATPDEVAQAKRAAVELISYFGALVRERRRHPTDDLTSAVIDARDEDSRLSRRELVGVLLLLFGAGFETTMGMIGNGLLTVLGSPGAAPRLRSEPELLPTAVDELLRYETTTQLAGRVALEPGEIDGRAVEPGEWLFCFLGAANRDPLVFDSPDQVQLDRNPNPHLSFSSGVHHCLGAALARMELQVVFRRMLTRFPRLALAEEPAAIRWRPGISLRAPERLRVTF